MSEDKSHAPTPRRLQKAREDGRVAVSRELSTLASLSAGIAALAMQSNGAGVAAWLATCLQQRHFEGAATWGGVVRGLALASLPAGLAALGGYVTATLVQTGFLLHLTALQPDLSRINPLAGLKRLFSPNALVQVAKALAKLGLLTASLYLVLRHLLPALARAPETAPQTLLAQMFGSATLLVMLLLGAQALIAGADFGWERVRHARQLRMSFQELRDEHKESEGNPQIRHKLRQLARMRAGRRMMTAVPKAAVVITNPTHFAVALAYERGEAQAPRLVAKGADEVAARIRALAAESRVPIVANPPLARALYRVELDTEIPAEHFKAVAEIIAYVWRMRAQAMRR